MKETLTWIIYKNSQIANQHALSVPHQVHHSVASQMAKEWLEGAKAKECDGGDVKNCNCWLIFIKPWKPTSISNGYFHIKIINCSLIDLTEFSFKQNYVKAQKGIEGNEHADTLAIAGAACYKMKQTAKGDAAGVRFKPC